MKRIKLTFLILIFPLMTAWTAHKFYVSITKIEFVQEKQSLQIISKIFIDDIEDVLQKRYDPKISLATKKETQEDADILKRYILNEFRVSVNGKPVTLDYIGKEYETDVVKIYMEVKGISEVKSIEITNDMLTELFEEQQNIIHFKDIDSRRSLVLEKNNPKGMLNFN